MTPTAAIHVAKKQLGLDDDTYRAILVRETGKRSTKDMSPDERNSVLDALRRQGFKGSKKGLVGPYAKKLQALWIAAWNLGIVRDRRDAAMLSFIERQTGIANTRFLRDPADARKAVEGLKGWIAREAGVLFGTSKGQDFLEHDAGKIAWAQWCILIPGATLMGNRRDFHREVMEHVVDPYPGKPLGAVTPKEWRSVMNAFGEQIRSAKR